MELLTRALATPKKDARYAYIAPFREQAKTVAWTYLKHYAYSVVVDPEKDFRESDLMVKLYNGSTVRLFGADNPNSLRGIYLDGVVLDEYADMRPGLWGEVIRPTLSDRTGWAVFIGTPRGKNAFWKIYNKAASDPDWMRVTLKASQTGILSESELADAKKTLTIAQYEQEYECSFDAAILGAIYASEIQAAVERIRPTPYDGSTLVHTVWDIGFGDSTAIWFWQMIAGEIRIIDYYEANGEKAPFYIAQLKSKGYLHDTAWLPFDAEQERITGLAFAEVLRGSGLNVRVLPRLGLEEGINAARMMFSRCVFDEVKTQAGLDALKAYQWSYNQRMDEIKTTPIHNWASHGADAFRYLAQAVKDMDGFRPMKLPKLNYGKLGIV